MRRIEHPLPLPLRAIEKKRPAFVGSKKIAGGEALVGMGGGTWVDGGGGAFVGIGGVGAFVQIGGGGFVGAGGVGALVQIGGPLVGSGDGEFVGGAGALVQVGGAGALVPPVGGLPGRGRGVIAKTLKTTRTPTATSTAMGLIFFI